MDLFYLALIQVLNAKEINYYQLSRKVMKAPMNNQDSLQPCQVIHRGPSDPMIREPKDEQNVSSSSIKQQSDSSNSEAIGIITPRPQLQRQVSKVHKALRTVTMRTFPGVVKQQQQQKTAAAQFQVLLNGMSQSDFSFIYCKIQKILKLTEAAFQQYISTKQHEDLLEAFLTLFQSKVEPISYSKSILPTLYSLIARIRAHISVPRCGKQSTNLRQTGCFKVYPKQCTSDLLFRHFIQACQTSKTRTGEYYIRDQNDARISLKDYVAKVPEFDLVYWPQIFKIAEQTVRKESDGEKEQDLLKEEYLSNLHLQETPNLQCLGCSKFFFQNHNIFLPTGKPKLVLLGSVLALSFTAGTLKEEVCGLLNNKGGIVLFGCEREYFRVIAKGDTILEKNKASIEEEIRKSLREITPMPHAEIDISFVPLKEDPSMTKGILQTDKDGKKFIQRGFVEGQYVVRVKVTPLQGSTAYYWLRNEKPTFTVRKETLNNHPNSKEHFSGRHFTSFIKRKIALFINQVNGQSKKTATEVSKLKEITHNCDKPYQGLPLLEKVAVKQSLNPEQAYKYASVLVVKHAYHQTILERLRKFSVDGEICIRFQNYKLKGVVGVAIYYHNTRFEEMQAAISGNKDFEFEGKAMMLLPITPYLKLTGRNARNVMDRADFQSLAVWLKKEFKESSLKMWKFITDENDTEFYLQSGSKAGNLFMYIVMTNFKECSQFKTPKGVERMSERERSSRLKLQYVSE